MVLGISTIVISGCSKESQSKTTESSVITAESSKEQTSTDSSKAIISLSQEELAVTAYLENYMNQNSTKSVESAIKEVTNQPDFMINQTNDMYIVNQSGTLTKGILSSNVKIDSTNIYSRDFDGNQQSAEQNYTVEELTNKYSPYVDKIKALVAHSQTNKENITNLTNEELVMAYLIECRDAKTTTIDDFIASMLNGTWFLEKTDVGYTLRDRTGINELNFIIDESTVTSNEESNKPINTKELNLKYKSYKNDLEKLVTKFTDLEAERIASSQESQVDTKSLTSEQAISWVKKYLLQKGATNTELDSIDYQTEISEDGFLTISLYTWNQTQTSKTLAYIYRVDSMGELQEGSLSDSSKWGTISTSYIE